MFEIFLVFLQLSGAKVDWRNGVIKTRCYYLFVSNPSDKIPSCVDHLTQALFELFHSFHAPLNSGSLLGERPYLISGL